MGDIRRRRCLLGPVRAAGLCCVHHFRMVVLPCCCSIERRGAIRVPGTAGGHVTATNQQAAVREAHEEAGLPVERVYVRTTVVTSEVLGTAACRGPTTVVADAAEPLATVPNGESAGCAGWMSTRWRRCRCILVSPPAGRACGRSSRGSPANE